MKIELILSILVTMCIALASFSLKWTFDANAKLEVLQEQVKALSNNNDKDMEQDRQLKLLWISASWSNSEINVIRFKLGLEPESPNYNK
jgi:MFS superfamily sulfate permease-like transporter